MARKIEPGHAREQEQDGAREAAVLFPDASVIIGGEEITVRELRFEDSLRLAPLINPIVQALCKEFQSSQGVSLSAMREAFAANYQQVKQLIAVSCDRDLEWVRSLSDKDGEALLLTWQKVHMDFFVRRVAADYISKKSMAMELAGAMFSPPSSNMGTTRSGSGSTPRAN